MKANNQTILAISFMISYCFFVTTTDAIIKYLGMAGISSAQMMFVRGVVGSILLFPLIYKKSEPIIYKENIKLNFCRAVFSFVSGLIWFHILEFVHFTKLMAIGFCSTLFTVLLAIIFFKERASWQKTLSLLIGFSGAIVVIRPGTISFDYYLLFGLAGSFAWACSLIVAKKLSSRESSLHMTFILTMFWIPLSSVLAIKSWVWPSLELTILLISMTITACLGQVFLAKAFSRAELNSLVPFEFTILIFASFFSYFFFDEVIDIWTFVGASMILMSSIWVISHEKKKHDELKKGDIIL